MISKVSEAKNKIDYYVVDEKQSLDNRPFELNKFSRLHFMQNFKDVNSNIDIIHIGSTLQYIEDWKSLLEALNDRFKPAYFVFSDLLAGNIPTFVSHQIFYKKKIPHLFINFSEFSDFMVQKLSLKILFKTKFIRKILNQEEVFLNYSLPEKFRIDLSYNLVFARS